MKLTSCSTNLSHLWIYQHCSPSSHSNSHCSPLFLHWKKITIRFHFLLNSPHRQCRVCSHLQHLQHQLHHFVDTWLSILLSLLQLSPWLLPSSLSPSTSRLFF